MKKLWKILPNVSLVLGLLAFVAIFFPALVNEDGETLINGLKATFGGELSSFVIGTTPIVNATAQLSFANVLAFTLPLLVAISVFVVRDMLKMKGWMSSLLKVGLFAAFLLSFILFLNLANNTTYIISIFDNDIHGDFANASLTIGPILGLIFTSMGILSTGVELALPFVKK